MADINKFELGGVSAFKMGDTGADGAMGTVLTEYVGIKEGTFTFSIAVPTATDINIEESDFAYTTKLSGSPKTFTFELFGVKFSELPNFLGGTFTPGVGGTRDKYSAPSALAEIFQSVSFTSKDSNGNESLYSYVKCRVSAEQTQTNTKTDLVGLIITMSILQPLTDLGVPTDPWFVEGETIT